jgi:hypothetical protein
LFDDFLQNLIVKNRKTAVKANDIGIRNDLLVAMSASEEVKILKVSCRDPKDKKVKIIAKTFHLFITQYK